MKRLTVIAAGALGLAAVTACDREQETRPPAPKADAPLSTPSPGTAPSQSMPGGTSAAAATPAAKDARVYFIEPKNGAGVSGPLKVVFGLSGMGVAPAGTEKENTGHHHLLIDEPKVDLGMPLPVSEQIRHFGGGQTETTITLAPGSHTLQLLLGDLAHRPHSPPVQSEKITVTVR